VGACSVKMPVMIFVGGAVAGCVVGLVAGALLQRRFANASVLAGRGVALTIALIALLVAGVALANSERDRDGNRVPLAAVAAGTGTSAATAGAPSSTAPGSSTTSSAPPSRLVSVPNVSHPPLQRNEAVAILKRAGFEVNVETLPLANVPAGFVLSQNPLPAAKAGAGSTVTLVVTAAA
jgi:hypothetical protein